MYLMWVCGLLVLSVPVLLFSLFFFFFNDTATTEIYTLSLHDALPIWPCSSIHLSAWAAASNCSSLHSPCRSTKLCAALSSDEDTGPPHYKRDVSPFTSPIREGGLRSINEGLRPSPAGLPEGRSIPAPPAAGDRSAGRGARPAPRPRRRGRDRRDCTAA